MDEIFEITEFVQEEAGYGTDLIWGNCFDETLGEKINVTLIATGFEEKKTRIEKEEPNRVVVNLDDEQKAAPQQPENYTSNKPNMPNNLSNVGFESKTNPKDNTFEFDDVKETVNKYQKRNFAYNSSPNDDNAINEDQQNRRAQESEDRRRERLRNDQVKLNNPKTINELESEPAYLRRGVQLDNIPNSNESQISQWTIGEEEEPQMRKSKRLPSR